MQTDEPLYNAYRHLPFARLLLSQYRLPVEQAASAYFGEAWRVKTYSDLYDYASHPSAVLMDGSRGVFVKLSEAANGLDQLEVELAGLRDITALSGVRTPDPVGILPVEGGVMLVLEAVQPVERTPERWREMGRTLARIHQVKGAQNGYDRQGYFGPLYQDNRPMDSWLAFYAERRVWMRLMEAIDSGHLPTEDIRKVERLIARLPRLDIPEVTPSLLHGDAQQNNYITAENGTLVIDPAICWGNPEYDLAYIDYFAPVPEAVFDGYREVLPIDPGFPARRDLWRVSAYLGLVAVMGPDQLPGLLAAVEKYL